MDRGPLNPRLQVWRFFAGVSRVNGRRLMETSKIGQSPALHEIAEQARTQFIELNEPGTDTSDWAIVGRADVRFTRH